jgi:hypothetical protein
MDGVQFFAHIWLFVYYLLQSHVGFGKPPQQFALAFKSFDMRVNWFINEAVTDIYLRECTIPNAAHGGLDLLYFDSATFQTMKYPSKASEVAYCRRDSPPEACKGHGFDPERPNLPVHSAYEVKQLGERVGKGLFAKMDIPKDSYVGLDQLMHPVYMDPTLYTIVEWMTNQWEGKALYTTVLDTYAIHYGHTLSHHVRIATIEPAVPRLRSRNLPPLTFSTHAIYLSIYLRAVWIPIPTRAFPVSPTTDATARPMLAMIWRLPNPRPTLTIDPT